MRREGRSRATHLLLLFLVLGPAGTALAQVRRVRALATFDARVAEFAREGAMRRLRSPECQRVLTDFADADGRPLAESLAPFAMGPDEYLAQLPLLDGAGHLLCENGQSQLLTSQGVKRVFVCKGFLKTVSERRDDAELYLIHEVLHTLGLGENPPTSQQITQQVKRRCAP